MLFIFFVRLIRNEKNELDKVIRQFDEYIKVSPKDNTTYYRRKRIIGYKVFPDKTPRGSVQLSTVTRSTFRIA